MPQISLIIPFFNREQLLPRTLASLTGLGELACDVVFVDNGSTDKSRKIVEAFIEDNAGNGLKASIVCAEKRGACFARNAGLQATQADYVCFFDSDDEFDVAFLHDAFPLLAQKPDLIAAATLMVFPDGTAKKRRIFPSASVRDQVLSGMLATQGMIIRRQFLISVGAWNEALPKWNDWELGVRLLLAKPRLLWLNGTYHRIHQHPDSLTGAGIAPTYRQIVPALQAVAALPLPRSEQRALAARKVIIAGSLQRDGQKAEAAALLRAVLRVHPSLLLLYIYTRAGGKGAWWVFRTLWP